MAVPLSVYLLSRDQAFQRHLLQAVEPGATTVEPDASEVSWDDLSPGLVLVDAATVSGEETLRLARRLVSPPGAWIVALVDEGEDPSVRVLSLAPPITAAQAAEFAHDPEAAPGTVLELQRVLADVARVRHDLNNPLTSALAETQLLLMDAGEGEVMEALEIVQAQLRRIRDLIASTSHLRPLRD